MEKTIRAFLFILIISGAIFTGCDRKNVANEVAASGAVSDPLIVLEENADKYFDGVYESNGAYQSPAGEESIDVDITLKDDVVESLLVTPNASNEVSQKMQALFVEGINVLVVGKKIDELGEMAQVNGSSLTPKGFLAAVESIKKEALR